MSDEIYDGGNAFPQRAKGDGGMSLRDWFAGQALVSFGQWGSSTKPKTRAVAAYEVADAMLEARKARHK